MTTTLRRTVERRNITVQHDLIFRCVISEPCRGTPAKDTSPKARKTLIRAAGVGYSHGMSADTATCLQAKAVSFASRYMYG